MEGNFGTGLVAFFTFIKWLLYLNLFTCVLLTVFILVPQIFLVHSKVISPLFTLVLVITYLELEGNNSTIGTSLLYLH